MFVTVSAYRARTGEEDAIIALHEELMGENSHIRVSLIEHQKLIIDERFSPCAKRSQESILPPDE